MFGESHTRTRTDRRTLLKTIGGTMAIAGYGGYVSAVGKDGPEIRPNQWSGPRSGPSRTGTTGDEGPTPYATLDWRMDLDGSMYHIEPIVTDELVYLAVTSNNTPGDSAGYLGAYDIETGERRWERTDIPSPKTPATDDDKIYVPAKMFETSNPGDGGFYALDAVSGDTIWTRTDHDVWSPPIVTDDRILSSNRHGTYAFDPETGDTVWTADGVTGLAEDVGDALSYTNGTVFVSDGNALDATDGSVKWRASPDDTTLGNPAATDKMVYFTQNNYLTGDDDTVKIQARSPDTGAVQWMYESSDENRWNGRPAITDEYVLLVDFDGESTLKALDAMTGERAWTTAIPGSSVSNPVVGDGTIYLGGKASGQGVIHAIDGSTGERYWSYLLDSSDLQTSPENPPAAGEPVVSNGKLYAATYPANTTFDYEYTFYSNFFVLGSCDRRPDGDTRLPGGNWPNGGDGNPDEPNDGDELRPLDACIEVTPDPDSTDFDGGDVLRLDASCSTGNELRFEWDIDGDGAYEWSGGSVHVSLPSCGSLAVTVRITDGDGETDTATVSMAVN